LRGGRAEMIPTAPQSEKTITKTRNDETTKPDVKVTGKAMDFEVRVFILPFLIEEFPFRAFALS